MTGQLFKTARKGYDPAEVDAAMESLRADVRDLEGKLAVTNEAGARAAQQVREQAQVIEDLSNLSTALQKQLEEAAEVDTASFDHLGQRIAQMLTIANEEAIDMRERAREESDRRLIEVRAVCDQMLADAERTSEEMRAQALSDATETIAKAEQRGAQMRADQNSEAAAARDQAAALVESQRAAAAAATIEFERTLAERREEALSALEADAATRHQEIAEAVARLNEVRGEAQRTEFQARERAESILREAEQRSHEVISDAQERADSIRLNAERELAAAMSRRDSVNQQLAGIRQMLGAYGGLEAAQLAGGIVEGPEQVGSAAGFGAGASQQFEPGMQTTVVGVTESVVEFSRSEQPADSASFVADSYSAGDGQASN